MNNTTYTGYISLLLKGTLAVFPITSADGVLLEPTGDTTKLSEKLVEIDTGIEQITKVTNAILKDGDGSIKCTEDGLVHAKTTNIPKGLNPTVNEAIYKFKIDNNGHITDIKKAGLEDFGIGMPIKYCGEYPTNNTFTPSVGEMYLVNTGFISKYNKGDVNDFAIYDGETFNIILSDIDPNVNLNNGSSILYGTAPATIYAPAELGGAGLVLTTNSTEDGLEWKPIYAPTELGNKGMILGTDGKKLTWMDYPNLTLPSLYAGKNAKGTFITYNRSNVYLQGDDYISVNWGDTSKIQFSLNSDKLKTSGISFNVSSSDKATLSSGGLSVTLTGDNVSFSNDNGNLKLTASKPGAGIGLTYEGNTLKANLELTLGITSISEDNLVTVTTQLGTSDGGKDAAIFGSTAFTITGDDNIKIGNDESAITLSTDGLAKSDELKSLSTSLSTNVTNLQNSFNTLRNTVRSLSYIETIKGDLYINSSTNNKTVNLTFNENKLLELIPRDYEVFGWDLEFGGGLIPMPHENALWITKETGGYIKLPYPGTYKIKFKGVSPLEVAGLTSKITINGVDLDGFYNGTAIYKELITTSNDGKITIGAEYAGSAIFDISITSSRDRDIKLLTKESVSFVADYDSRVNSGLNMINKLLNRGFYIFSFKIKGPSPIGLMCWPIIDPSPAEPLIYNGVDLTKNRYFRNNAVKYYSINESTYTTINSPYYYIPNSSLVLIRTGASGNYSIKDFTITKLEFVDNIMDNSIINSSTINNSVINNAYNSTINSSTINNPLLSLTSQNSKLYNRVVEFLNKLYIQLVYEVDNKIIWTLDLNGLTMGSSDIPMVTIKEKYYFVRNNPYEINNFSLTSSCQELVVKIEDDQIIHESGVEGSKGYYISSIAQMNSDGSATHTLLYYQPDAVINKIRRTIIILKDGKIQDGILI